ncbi:MAG: HPr(Ser) kinase/phosphatase [Erysipelotrichaceae bacterium]|nr:HPr(Ser) kinase/phosphatase [Erysipelotrichaceae bacterium]
MMNELKNQLSIRRIKEYFNLEQVSGDDSSLDRWTIAPDINRPGLELAGYKETGELKRIVVIGFKERRYIDTLDYNTQFDRFGFLTDSYTPCIILTHGQSAPQALLDVARPKNFPVFLFPGETYELSSELVPYLTRKLAPREVIHGQLMNIYGIGVLIIGDSGIGKSELCLDLIKRGHVFVADDLVEVYKTSNTIYGTAPQNLKKMIEVRGIGIVDVGLTFGLQCYQSKYHINFVIRMLTYKNYIKTNPDRLNPIVGKMNICGMEKDMIEIPVTEGKNMPVIVETAVAKYIQTRNGIDSNQMFIDRIEQEILSKDKG